MSTTVKQTKAQKALSRALDTFPADYPDSDWEDLLDLGWSVLSRDHDEVYEPSPSLPLTDEQRAEFRDIFAAARAERLARLPRKFVAALEAHAAVGKVLAMIGGLLAEGETAA